MRCNAIAEVVLITTLLLGGGVAVAQDSATTSQRIAEAEREYVAAFRDTAMVPIMFPRGHEPGDVLTAQGDWLSRRDDCFRKVDIRNYPSRLPNIEVSWSAAARLFLAANDLAEASLRGKIEDVVKVKFEGVRLVSVSLEQFRRQVRSDVCPDLNRALVQSAIPAQNWLLLGDVLMGKPVIRVTQVKGGGGSVSLLASLAGKLGWRARAEGGADLSRAETVELLSDQEVPLAFRPALVRVTPDLFLKYRASQPERPTLEAFNPQDQAHRAAVDAWAAGLAEAAR